MNLLHISDIHFRKCYEACNEGYKGMLSCMQSPLIPLEKCIKHAQKKADLDLVIISGDLTEDGEVDDYHYLKTWLIKQLGEVDMLVTLGNHDVKENFRVGWLKKAPSVQPYNQVMHYPDVTIISFDTSQYGVADGVVDETQYQWLKQTLAACDNRPILFVTHHHLLVEQVGTPRWPGAERLLALLADVNLCGILTGHTHHPFMSSIQRVPYFTVAGMSFIGEELGDGLVRFEERYGYNMYQIKEGRLVYQTSENFMTGNFLKNVDMRT